jgi:hypothetical protein
VLEGGGYCSSTQSQTVGTQLQRGMLTLRLRSGGFASLRRGGGAADTGGDGEGGATEGSARGTPGGGAGRGFVVSAPFSAGLGGETRTLEARGRAAHAQAPATTMAATVTMALIHRRCRGGRRSSIRSRKIAATARSAKSGRGPCARHACHPVGVMCPPRPPEAGPEVARARERVWSWRCSRGSPAPVQSPSCRGRGTRRG